MPEEMKQAQQAAAAAEGSAAAGGGGGGKPPPTQVVPLSANGVDGRKVRAVWVGAGVGGWQLGERVLV